MGGLSRARRLQAHATLGNLAYTNFEFGRRFDSDLQHRGPGENMVFPSASLAKDLGGCYRADDSSAHRQV